MLTCKLRDGTEVLAKPYNGEPYPVTYANYTQADKKCAELGNGWQVRRPRSPARAIYIQKVLTTVVQPV